MAISKSIVIVGLVLAALWASMSTPAFAEPLITNGEATPASGVLNGYFVQIGDRTVCANPFVEDSVITCQPDLGKTNFGPVWATSRGTLQGLDVKDTNGELLCSSPTVWPNFRGPQSYLVCD